MPSFVTSNRHGYSVKFSPFDGYRLVVATSQLYGLAGGGTLYFLEQNENELKEIRQFEWTDGLFDVIWSNQHDNLVITSSGDGSMQLWDLNSLEKYSKSKPIVIYSEHTSEIYSLDWGGFWHLNNILSASWDSSLKIWDPTRSNSLLTFKMDSNVLVYGATFAPYIPNVFCSVSTDGILNLWNSLDFSGKPIGKVHAHEEEVLTCDWNKLNPWLVTTAGADGLIKGWDIRNLKDEPIFELLGSEDFAVRKIKYSPFLPNILASVSFDCTTRIWDISKQEEHLEVEIKNHSEFIYGLDWNLHHTNQIADCGWDSNVNIFNLEFLETT